MKEMKFKVVDKKSKAVSNGVPFDWFLGEVDEDLEFPLTGETLPLDDFIFFRDDYDVIQYTGLNEHDNDDPKDNREIFEGTIVEFIGGERLSVEWNDDICQWQYSDGSPINDGDRYGRHRKIIGNIYENPELLNQ